MTDQPSSPDQPPPSPSLPPPLPPRARLGVISLGLAVGVTAAIYVFLLGVAAGLFGWGVVAVGVLSNLFIGYEPTMVGSIAGAVWAFVNGLIGGSLIGWLYNSFLHTRR